MSYDISLYKIETREKQQRSNDIDFFDKDENLVPFTEQQLEKLKNRLLKYDYKLIKEDDHGLHFSHVDDFGTALLAKKALYFTANWNKSSIFEIGMTASEFTDTGEYSKYDFQNGEWETW